MQIIPPSKQAGFDIIFSSKIQQNFSGNVKYIINNKYEFSFQVTAHVDPVKLELAKDTVKLSFQEDSVELFTTETLRIFNNGNSNAGFQWLTNEGQTFSVLPKEAWVKPGQFLDC